jgi:small-conductance mechanosensitive channel
MKNMFRQVGYRLTNFIKYIMAFKDIFKKTNDYNEKVIIGFLSFMVMVIAIIVDLVTGYMGKALELNEYIFDAFMYITLGSFLPDVLEKFAAMKNGGKTNNEE